VDGTNNEARFFKPMGIAIDPRGNLYVADKENCLIRKVTPVGTNWVTTTIGGLAGQDGNADGIGSEARFNYMRGIAVDAKGTVYVADTFNNVIRMGVPVEPVMGPVTHTNGAVSIDWNGAEGRVHQVQYNADLSTTNWANLGEPRLSGTDPLTLTDLIGTNAQRFYRVRVEP
jgi:sugar lactone lactonase YvrE